MPKEPLIDLATVPAPIAHHVTPKPQPEENADLLRQRLKGLAVVTLLLLAAFGKPLLQLAVFAAHNIKHGGNSELYSHIFLIPVISLYLIWLDRRGLTVARRLEVLNGLVPAAIGFGVLAAYWVVLSTGWQPEKVDYLAAMAFSLLALWLAAVLVLLGTGFVRRYAFALAMLIFVVPFPTLVHDWIESFLEYGSAYAAHGLLVLSGMPVLRQGVDFQLPGFDMVVAPECSGIHSTLVLFITSLLAGRLFLRTPRWRAVLTLAVLPLALLRNGLRIFTIAQLCVRISPNMINHYIHRQGGPIFFLLSLIPFFLLLLFLRRYEQKALADGEHAPKTKV